MTDKLQKTQDEFSVTPDTVQLATVQRSGKVAQVVKAAPAATVERWQGFAKIVAKHGATVPQRNRGEERRHFMLYRLQNGSPEFKADRAQEMAQAAAKGINAILRKLPHGDTVECRAMQSVGGWVVAAFRKGIANSQRIKYNPTLWDGGEA